ncbi:MAG: CPBP family intramembrane metalloprotease [Actinomycetota bacterium]|nr:CPBP family intramembrane metalloprotease [Actinomycetota bacterium]
MDPRPGGTAPPPPAPVRRWGLGDVLLGMVVGLCLSSVFASAWLAVTGDADLGLGGRAASQVGLWTGLVGAVVLAARRKGSGRVAEDFGFRARWSDLGTGVAAALGAQFVVVPLVALLLLPLLGRPEVSGPVEDLVNDARGPAFAGLVLTAVIGAPIVEELFFRGLLLRSLEARFGTGWAVGGSSVIFGLSHPNDLSAAGVVVVMVSLAALAALLAVLVVRTGRLAPAIVAHAAFNALNLAVAALQ